MSVWLHILSAAVWIGGMVFLVVVLVPVLRRPQYRTHAADLMHLAGVRYRALGWICLSLLALTGTVQLAYRGFGWADLLWNGRLWQGGFGGVLGVKLLVFAVILALSAIHDFVIGPRATAVWAADPSSPRARALRRQASWFGRVNLVLALLAVAGGVMLVRGVPF